MPWHLCHPSTALAQVLSSDVAAASSSVSLPLSRPVIHKPALGGPCFLPGFKRIAIEASHFFWWPTLQGFPTQTWYSARMVLSLYQGAPGKPRSMSLLRLFPQPCCSPLWSLIKSFLLPSTTTNHSRLQYTAFPRLRYARIECRVLPCWLWSPLHVSSLGLCCNLTVCPVTWTLLHPSWSHKGRCLMKGFG